MLRDRLSSRSLRSRYSGRPMTYHAPGVESGFAPEAVPARIRPNGKLAATKPKTNSAMPPRRKPPKGSPTVSRAESSPNTGTSSANGLTAMAGYSFRSSPHSVAADSLSTRQSRSSAGRAASLWSKQSIACLRPRAASGSSAGSATPPSSSNMVDFSDDARHAASVSRPRCGRSAAARASHRCAAWHGTAGRAASPLARRRQQPPASALASAPSCRRHRGAARPAARTLKPRASSRPRSRRLTFGGCRAQK